MRRVFQLKCGAVQGRGSSRPTAVEPRPSSGGTAVDRRGSSLWPSPVLELRPGRPLGVRRGCGPLHQGPGLVVDDGVGVGAATALLVLLVLAEPLDVDPEDEVPLLVGQEGRGDDTVLPDR